MAYSNWWMYHGDAAHSGLATGSPIKARNVHTLKLLHDINVPGPVLSVPALVDGFIYVGLANSHDAAGATGGQLLKIKAESGETAAKFEWNIDPTEGDSHGFMGMGCTPAVFKDTGQVFFSAFNGKLYCLNDSDLTPQWITDLRHADTVHNEPVTNVAPGGPPAAGWSSPVIAPRYSERLRLCRNGRRREPRHLRVRLLSRHGDRQRRLGSLHLPVCGGRSKPAEHFTACRCEGSPSIGLQRGSCQPCNSRMLRLVLHRIR